MAARQHRRSASPQAELRTALGAPRQRCWSVSHPKRCRPGWLFESAGASAPSLAEAVVRAQQAVAVDVRLELGRAARSPSLRRSSSTWRWRRTSFSERIGSRQACPASLGAGAGVVRTEGLRPQLQLREAVVQRLDVDLGRAALVGELGQPLVAQRLDVAHRSVGVSRNSSCCFCSRAILSRRSRSAISSADFCAPGSRPRRPGDSAPRAPDLAYSGGTRSP